MSMLKDSGGGVTQVSEGGYPDWLVPFVQNEVTPYMSAWLQGQTQSQNPNFYLQGIKPMNSPLPQAYNPFTLMYGSDTNSAQNTQGQYRL